MERRKTILCQEIGLRGCERVGCEMAAADGVGWGCLECEKGRGWWGGGVGFQLCAVEPVAV